MAGIRINELRVKGITKDYFINFKDGFNVIAGEIYTGKSSILDLIDYCLGAKNPPTYPEILRNGRSALLELTINNDTFIIERPLYSSKNKAYVHQTSMQNIEEEHEIIEVSSIQRRDDVSISSYVLTKLNLWNIPLKEAPTQDSTDIDIMSLRDYLWFCYLNRKRVAGAQLLFENTPMMRIKLRQVFDVIFNIYSERIAKISSEINTLEEKIAKMKNRAMILEEFAKSEGIPVIETLSSTRKQLVDEIDNNEVQLQSIDEKVSGKSEIASELRKKVVKLEKDLQDLRVNKRYHETTLKRLIPLRGQYSEDIRKLHFLQDAKEIIDPIRISRCPVCLSHINQISDSNCPLCSEPLLHTQKDIDVKKEIGTIKRKMNELVKYTDELEEEIRKNVIDEKKIIIELKQESKRLDGALQTFVSPYLSEREELVSIISKNRNEIKHIDELVSVRKNIELISENRAKLEIEKEKLMDELKLERENSIDQKEILQSLSETFTKNLNTVHFPKLSDSYIDDKLMPFIRDAPYSALSSEGAINLASLCWISSIIMESTDRDTNHPNLLMVDSIQRGIGLGVNVSDEEFRDIKIVNGIYELLISLTKYDHGCQIIAIDNHPPAEFSQYIIKYYSADPKKPPYGFIDDDFKS